MYKRKKVERESAHKRAGREWRGEMWASGQKDHKRVVASRCCCCWCCKSKRSTRGTT